MAKITEAVSSLSVKVNVGDYQSVDFFGSLKAEISDGELLAVVQDKLNRTLHASMLARLRGHFRARGKKYDDATICKMYGLTPPKPEPEFG